MILQAEVAVIGAGVVGLACAFELSARRPVVLLERHEGYGRETSSHNSGVVHAGIYYPADWLKTTLCIEGNRMLYAWAERHGVRVRRCGKLVIALNDEEVPQLEALLAAAQANGVPELSLLPAREVAGLEPAVRAAAAVYSGTSGVVDQMELMRSFLSAAQANGTMVAFKHTVTCAQRSGDRFLLTGAGPEGEGFAVRADVLVNAAGPSATDVAATLGYPLDGEGSVPRLRHTFNKGRYYDIVSPAKASQLTHLVYPLPHGDRSGLGVHVTLDIDGGVHLGPDTEWLPAGAPLDYRADDTRRAQFVASARSYLPWLTEDDVMPGQVGYRAKLHESGGGPCDFLIWHDRGYVHLGGIESPGMTASLAIARTVASLLGL